MTTTPTQPAAPDEGWGNYLEEMAAELAAKAAAKQGTAGNAKQAATPKLYLASAAMPAAQATSLVLAAPAQSFDPMPNRRKTGHYPALASRSALFGIGRPRPNDPDLPLAPMAAHANYHLEYEGPRLTLHDKAVWEAAIDLAKASGRLAGADVSIPLRAIATQMKLASSGGPQLDSIWGRIKRLERARVSFTTPTGHRVNGALLGSATKQGQSVAIAFDPAIARHLLGRGDDQFAIDAARRRLLGSGLAQWAHDFISMQNDVATLDLRHLRRLCGYEGEKRHFSAALDKALEEVACNAPTLLKSHKINRNGQDSDDWTVDMAKGTEEPSFASATRPRKPAANGAPSAPATPPKKRRGGVAL